MNGITIPVGSKFIKVIQDPYNENKSIGQYQGDDEDNFLLRKSYYSKVYDKQVLALMVDGVMSTIGGKIAASGFVSDHWKIDVSDFSPNINFSKAKQEIGLAILDRLVNLVDVYRGNGLIIETKFDSTELVKSNSLGIIISTSVEKTGLVSKIIRDKDLIFGFPSNGQASWEESEMSGIMPSEIALAHACLIKPDNSIPENHPGFGHGQFNYDDCPNILKGLTIGEALFSPTRQWPILIKMIIDELKENNALCLLHGVRINDEGGAVSIIRQGNSAMAFRKDMSISAPIFQLINRNYRDSKEFFRRFNCGVGMDVIGEDHPIFIDTLKKVSIASNLPLYRLGACQRIFGTEMGLNEVYLKTSLGDFSY